MEAAHALGPVIILLIVGVAAIMVMRPLHMSPIVGYLFAGMLVGPHGLALIEESKTTHLLSELGVVFLLFDIGLHFSMAQMWDARRDILGLGPLQVMLCTAAFAGIAMATGFSFSLAVIVGAALAISSTAVAAQTMADHHQQHSPVGTSATAVLIFQDIFAIFLLILAGSMGGESASIGQTIGIAAIKAVAAFALALLAGHILIPPLFRFIAKSRDEELFTAVALLLVLATAMATGMLDLSLTLGAFLAGMIIGETPYRHIVQTETKPFRGLLLGFFFITVGMMLDVNTIFEKWWVIALLSVVIIGVKVVFIFMAARLLNTSEQSAFQIAVLLAQGSEFAFVIFGMPAMREALGQEDSAILITSIAISMALTPPLWLYAHRYASRIADKEWEKSKAERAPSPKMDIPVIIVGMSEIGQRVADGLTAHDIRYRAIEMDHDRFVHANSEGYAVAFGDATDLRLMHTIKAAQANTIAVTFARFDLARVISPIVQQRYPDLMQFVAVGTRQEKALFETLGISAVRQHSFPTGIDLAAEVLRKQGVSEKKIEKWMRRQQDIELEALPANDLDIDKNPTPDSH